MLGTVDLYIEGIACIISLACIIYCCATRAKCRINVIHPQPHPEFPQGVVVGDTITHSLSFSHQSDQEFQVSAAPISLPSLDLNSHSILPPESHPDADTNKPLTSVTVDLETPIIGANPIYSPSFGLWTTSGPD